MKTKIQKLLSPLHEFFIIVKYLYSLFISKKRWINRLTIANIGSIENIAKLRWLRGLSEGIPAKVVLSNWFQRREKSVHENLGNLFALRSKRRDSYSSYLKVMFVESKAVGEILFENLSITKGPNTEIRIWDSFSQVFDEIQSMADQSAKRKLTKVLPEFLG